MNPFARSITTATAGARAVRTRPGRWGRVLAWTALIAGLAATIALWMQNERAARAQLDRVLEQRLELVQARLGESFSIYSALLLAARGWLAGPHPVDERGWRAFVAKLDPQQRAPGLHHLAFAMRVPTGEMPLTARTDAFDAGGARIGSARILRAEPPLPARLSGYDLMAHPVLAELLRTADGRSEPAVSPAVRLHRRDEPWILVVLPVEPHAARPLPGYAVAFVDIAALMQWIAEVALADVVVQVYDGPSAAEGRLLYRSSGEAAVQLTRTGPVHVEDRVWTVSVSPNAQLRSAVAGNTSTAILIAGSAVSLLLFLSLFGLASGQARAAMLALRMSDAARARERRFSQLARHAPMGVFIADPGGRYVFVNAHWRRLSGLSDAGASGDAWVDALHPQDRERVLAAWREAVRAGAAFQQDCRLLDRFGTENYVSFSAIPERDEHGDIVAYIGTCMDITARRRAELALTRANEELEQRVQSRTAELEQANAHLSREVEERRRAERERVEILQRQAALLHSIPDMAWLKDSELRFLAVNERVAALFGVSEQDIVGKNDYDFMPAEVARHNREEDLQVLHTGRTLRLDDMGRYGTQRWYEVVKSPVLDEHGRVIGVAGVARDITERKRAEEALRASNARLQALAEELGMRAHARSAMNELGGVLGACATLEDGQAALVRHLAALFPEGSGCLYWCCGEGKEAASLVSWGAESNSASTMTFDQCLALRQGQPHHLRLGVSAPACAHLLRVPGGGAVCAPLNLGERLAGLLYWEGPHLPDTVDEALAIERDTAWRQWTCAVAEYLGLALSNLALRHTLQIQARHDPLTDLFNRRYMEEALERELRRADRSRRPMGVIMADLDHFKRYNDTLGHDAGDRLLVALAECLRAQVRAGDIVCRYGGEEFLIILPETSLDLVTQRAEELRETVARQLGSFGGDAVPPVTMSLGVALYPIHAGDTASLVRAADAAMYRAKRSGRNRVEIAETGESTPPPQNASMSATSNSR